MDEEKHLILINGQDKTDSVASFQFRAGKYDVVYTTSPKVYSYQSSRVQILKLQQRIDPENNEKRKGPDLCGADRPCIHQGSENHAHGILQHGAGGEHQ